VCQKRLTLRRAEKRSVRLDEEEEEEEEEGYAKVGTSQDVAEAKATHFTSEGRIRTRDNSTRLCAGRTAVSTAAVV